MSLVAFLSTILVLSKYRKLISFSPPSFFVRYFYRGGKNVFTRPAPIDLSSARAYSFSLDLDLDEERADGLGGGESSSSNAKRGERAFMLEDEEDSDEE